MTEPTEATPTTPPADRPVPAAATPLPPEDLAAVRELALRAHPDVVPELVGGATVADLLASVEPARAAYRRIAEALPTVATPAPAPPRPVPPVPAGDAPRLTLDPDHLPPAEKIRRGLAERTRRDG